MDQTEDRGNRSESVASTTFLDSSPYEIAPMHPFVETISVTGGIVAALSGAIVFLTLFFRGISWISGGAKPDTIAVRGILKKNTLATVHVAGSQPFERVRFLGFTSSQGMKTQLPWEFNGMVILEDQSRTRFFVRAKDIRMIVVPSEDEPGAATG